MQIELEDVKMNEILEIMHAAKSPVPLGYISFHTGICEPLTILEKLVDKGLIRRASCSTWSCCMEPMFEVVAKKRS